MCRVADLKNEIAQGFTKFREQIYPFWQDSSQSAGVIDKFSKSLLMNLTEQYIFWSFGIKCDIL